MADYKTKHTFYSAWNYEREMNDLNAESEKGWQLVKGGCFSSRFEKNPDICYRYQLDYGKIENMGRYIEMFREQGWEYINSTFNGWHYFRKLYDPSLPESAYEIFTDRESLQEMRMRWARIAMGLGIALGLFFLVSLVRTILQPQLPNLVRTLTFGAESILLLFGTAIMRNPDANHNKKSDSMLLGTALTVIIIGAVASIALDSFRPDFQTSQSWSDSVPAAADENMAVELTEKDWLTFQVHYPDNYFLDLAIEADEPLTFAIENENGEPVYSITESHLEENNIRIPLKRGEYNLRLVSHGDGAVSVKATMD